MDNLEILIWLVAAILTGFFAHHRRNRRFFAWSVAALLFSPLIVFLFAAASRTLAEPQDKDLVG